MARRALKGPAWRQAGELMRLFKAECYGHGALPGGPRRPSAGGANSLGCGHLQEGVELRQGGDRGPLLVMATSANPRTERSCLHWQLMPMRISSQRQACSARSLAMAVARRMALHLKLDTGMTRLGI